MRFVESENFATARNGTHVSLNAVVASVHVHGLNLAAGSPGREQWISLVESELSAGDSVFVLRAGKNSEREAQATRLLLIHRFWKRSSSEYRVFLAIASNSSESSSSTACSGSTKVRVKLVGAVANSDRTLEGYGPNYPCKGFLENGDPYVVYLMLLYCDDFKPHLGKKGSFGGCYMLPLGLPPANRVGTSAIRVLGLTPPGVSTTEVLRAIIPDIIAGTADGSSTLDANGKEVGVFLDVVRFTGDTPAISHVLDVRGHNALAPCPWCSFLRDDNELHRGSRYGFSTAMNARHSSFIRFKSRAEPFQQAAPSDKDCQTLGFTRQISAESNPFYELARALSEAKKSVPKNVDENPVVPACLDPYRACVVAPDHFFFGLSQNVIEAATSCCSVPEKKAAESYMLIALRGYGLPVQNKRFGESASFLLSMSISQVSSVLLVAPAPFRTVKAMRGRKDSTKANGLVEGSILSKNPRNSNSSGVVLDLLQSFQSLVSESVFYPKSDSCPPPTVPSSWTARIPMRSPLLSRSRKMASSERSAVNPCFSTTLYSLSYHVCYNPPREGNECDSCAGPPTPCKHRMYRALGNRGRSS
jgi:hypothetical protein